MISVQNLTVSYTERKALDGISLNVPEGEWHGILGPNGSGKSTLFRVLSTLLAPSSGTFSVAGETNAVRIRRRLGVVFQSNSLDKKLSVWHNMVAQAQLHGLPAAKIKERVEKLLTHFRIADRRHDAVGTLSGGLMRRVEIAKSLLHEPSVLLLDEPSTGLDPLARREWLDLLAGIRRERQMTVLLTTHLLDEADRCDRLTMLHAGKVVAAGTPAELKAQVGGEVVEFGTRVPARIAGRFPGAQVADGVVRFEIASGARFAVEVAEAFPGDIDTIAIKKPTLEDVFFRHTGAKL